MHNCAAPFRFSKPNSQTAMKPNTLFSHFSKLLLLLAVLCAAPVLVSAAEDLDAVRARMEQRLPSIDDLKAKGAIGENNRGLLEVRSGGGNASGVVSAENRDRELVYSEIAKKNNTSADQVGRARARRIAANSAPGVWLQRDNGEWYRK